ncbi:MAG: HIT family protein [Actinobacteria bacterium]|nr:HIT family protein [Actinomycetota bacterium]
MSNDCFICRKQASGDALGAGVIYEDDLVFASHGVPSNGAADAYLGYAFVETKRHVPGLGELTRDEASAIGELVNDVAAGFRSSEGAEHVYAHVYGDGVPHLHVHLQARYPGTPREYWAARTADRAIAVSLGNWPDAPRGDASTVRALTKRLAAAVELRRRFG